MKKRFKLLDILNISTKSNSGFSMIELMVALGVSSIVSIGIMRINENLTKTVNTAETDMDYRLFIDGELKQKLSLKNNCTVNFAYHPTFLPGNPTNVDVANTINSLVYLKGLCPTADCGGSNPVLYAKSEDANPTKISIPDDNKIPFMSTAALTGNRADDIAAGSLVSGGNWRVISMTLGTMIQPDDKSPLGICPLTVVLRRNKGIANEDTANEKRYFFGVKDKTVTLDLSCKKRVTSAGIQPYLESCRLAESNVENIWKSRYSTELNANTDTNTGAYIYYDEQNGLGGYVTIGPRKIVGTDPQLPSAPLEIFSDAAVWMFPVFTNSITIPADSMYTFNGGAWGITESNAYPVSGSCLSINRWDEELAAVIPMANHCIEQAVLPANPTDEWPDKLGYSRYKNGIRMQRGDFKISNGNLNIGAYNQGATKYSNKMDVPGAVSLGYSREKEVVTNSFAIGSGNYVMRPNSGAVGGNNKVERKFSYIFGLSNWIQEPFMDTGTVGATGESQSGVYVFGEGNVVKTQRSIVVGTGNKIKRFNNFVLGHTIRDIGINNNDNDTHYTASFLPSGVSTLSLTSSDLSSALVSSTDVSAGKDYFVDGGNLGFIYRANNILASYDPNHANPAGGSMNENANPDYSLIGFNYSIGDTINNYKDAYSTFSIGKNIHNYKNGFSFGRNINLFRDDMMTFYNGQYSFSGVSSLNVDYGDYLARGKYITAADYMKSEDTNMLLLAASGGIRIASHGANSGSPNTYRNIFRITKGGNIEHGSVFPASSTSANRNQLGNSIEQYSASIASYNTDNNLTPGTAVFASASTTITRPSSSSAAISGNNAILAANTMGFQCLFMSGVIATYEGTLTCRPQTNSNNYDGHLNLIMGGGKQEIMNAETWNTILGGGYNTIANYNANSVHSTNMNGVMKHNFIVGGYGNSIKYSYVSSNSNPKSFLRNAILGSWNGRISDSWAKDNTGGTYDHLKGFNTIISSRDSAISHGLATSILGGRNNTISYNFNSAIINSIESKISPETSHAFGYQKMMQNNTIIGGNDVEIYGKSPIGTNLHEGGKNLVIGSDVYLYKTGSNNAAKGITVLTDSFKSSSANYQFPRKASESQLFDNSMYMRFTGYYLYTDVAANKSCNYLTNTGWTCSSSKTLKENFNSLDDEEMIDKILKLDFKRWSYIGDDTKNIDGERVTHITPFAEDFYETYKVGKDNKTIDEADLAGIASKTLQALYKGLEKLEKEIEYQKTFLGRIHSFIEKVKLKVVEFRERRKKNKERIEKLKRTIGSSTPFRCAGSKKCPAHF